MRNKERNYEVKINGIPQLKDMPKDLLDLLCVALLDSILSEKEDCVNTVSDKDGERQGL